MIAEDIETTRYYLNTREKFQDGEKSVFFTRHEYNSGIAKFGTSPRGYGWHAIDTKQTFAHWNLPERNLSPNEFSQIFLREMHPFMAWIHDTKPDEELPFIDWGTVDALSPLDLNAADVHVDDMIEDGVFWWQHTIVLYERLRHEIRTGGSFDTFKFKNDLENIDQKNVSVISPYLQEFLKH